MRLGRPRSTHLGTLTLCLYFVMRPHVKVAVFRTTLGSRLKDRWTERCGGCDNRCKGSPAIHRPLGRAYSTPPPQPWAQGGLPAQTQLRKETEPAVSPVTDAFFQPNEQPPSRRYLHFPCKCFLLFWFFL